MRTANDKKIIYPELSYELNGILFAVKKKIGRFDSERQYCDAIEALLKNNGIAYEREKQLPAPISEESSGRHRVDFLIENKIVLEVKAKPFITKNDYYQIQRYLSVLDKRLGILVNMRRYYIQPKRILNSRARE